uniref:Uncharacterized protein n=2 Tax=Haptolina brevifila TaxID=156173 RepID=A0A7S2DGJ9_9EUKA|mmetsp:Transcript_3829/g.8365  ORF Transcript_3829/g.8365 Transcript_3829/m.8365 type:complete len:145 (+) Transcript_3829:792-1226(+)
MVWAPQPPPPPPPPPKHPLVEALKKKVTSDEEFEKIRSEAMSLFFEPEHAEQLRKSSLTMDNAMEQVLKRAKVTKDYIEALGDDRSLDFEHMWVYIMEWAPVGKESNGDEASRSVETATDSTTPASPPASSATPSGRNVRTEAV